MAKKPAIPPPDRALFFRDCTNVKDYEKALKEYRKARENWLKEVDKKNPEVEKAQKRRAHQKARNRQSDKTYRILQRKGKPTKPLFHFLEDDKEK